MTKTIKRLAIATVTAAMLVVSMTGAIAQDSAAPAQSEGMEEKKQQKSEGMEEKKQQKSEEMEEKKQQKSEEMMGGDKTNKPK